MSTRDLIRTAALVLLLVTATACGSDDSSSATEPSAAEPEPGEPAVPDMMGSEPEPAAPDVNEPEMGEPEVGEPEMSEPEVAEPEMGVPEVGEPEVENPEVENPLSFCEGNTAHRYNPAESDELELWPDNLLVREDSASPTGLRLNIHADNSAWNASAPSLLQTSFSRFPELSGFATNGPVLVRFTGEVSAPATAAQESLDSLGIQLFDLETQPPTRVPYTAHLGNGNRDLFVQPLVPLRRGTRHALVITNDFHDAQGDCIAPSALQRWLLAGISPAAMFSTLATQIPEALEATEIDPEKVSAISVFTTHDDLATIRQAHETARDGDLGWQSREGCVVEDNVRRCDATFRAADFRTDGAITTATAQGSWDLPAVVYLPAEGEGPFPTILYGHGMGNERTQAREVANIVAPLGFAVVANDALHHGEHPSAVPFGNPALAFLGVDLLSQSFNPFVVRGNFNQTAFDRLQLLETIRLDSDIDGDGVADLDAEQLLYWGISLGGLLGPAITALDEGLNAGIFSMAGGRLTTFVTDTSDVADFIGIIELIVGSKERLDRYLVLVQSLADAGDPATWAPHVLRERFVEDSVLPHVLLPVVAQDDTVPPATGYALARALQTPHMHPVLNGVELLDVVEGPVSGNWNEGATTAAYFQFDRIGGDNPVAATHGNMPTSAQGALQVTHFLQTWLDTGIPEVIDPYAALETPPLP